MSTQETINNGFVAWRTIAASHGMNSKEIERHHSFISTQLVQGVAQTTYFKRSHDGPARAVEFLVSGKDITVITHFKTQNGQSPFGSGFQSIVKRAAITFSTDPTRTAGTLIADKSPQKGAYHEHNKEAIRQEGTILAKLKDAKHVRQLLANVDERGKKSGLLLVAMQNTLRSILSANFGFERNQKIKIANGLIIGLQEMKAKNIVHRDLHAANVALTYDDRWVIHDFGFAKAEGEKVAPGDSINAWVSSPRIVEERILGQESTARAIDDAWAAGIVLYEVDSGYLPSFDPDLRALFAAIQKGDKREIRAAYSTYTDAISAFKTELKNSTLVLRDVILDLLEGKDLPDCLNRLLTIPQDLEETVGIVKASESTEELTGYQTTEQLNNLFGAILN